MKLIISLLIIVLVVCVLLLVRNKEQFISLSIDAMEPNLKQEVETILNLVVTDINKNYNKELYVGSIDRVEKTVIEEGINYIVNVFIYNKRNFTNTNRKVTFDIDINDKEIIVNKITRGFSRDIPQVQRGGISSRGSTLYKASSDISKLESSQSKILDHSEVDYPETNKKMVNRNAWIIPKELSRNNLIIPTRKILHVWDCSGVEVTSDNMKDVPILNHGMKPINNIPCFNKYNFESKQENSNNSWLFDLASDSSSRPIGVTGASGTK
jgi:hypothetical protein